MSNVPENSQGSAEGKAAGGGDDELCLTRAKLAAAEQLRDEHYTRCASLLFSDHMQTVTTAEIQRWRSEYIDARSRLAAAERELQRWREITARRDPDDCAEGIRDLYDNWQTQRTRAETAERALADMTAERDEWKANLAAELDGAGEMRRQHGARDNESFPAFVARLAAERDAAMLVVAAAHAWQGEPSTTGNLTHCESNLVRALGNFATWQRAAIAASEQGRGEGA